MQPAGASAPLFEFERLTVDFPGRSHPAVKDLSFRIRTGESIGLIGESGSGKSLTALAMLGLVPPPGSVRAAAIRFEGLELSDAPAATWRGVRGRGIGMVFQEPLAALNPVLTLGDQIVEVIRSHERIRAEAARARARELLSELSFAEPGAALGAYPHQLSGGQRQRGMLAIALAARPRLLIADEPTTALDTVLGLQLLDLLAGLRDRFGLALLMISHDLAVVERICQRLLILRDGALVEEGEVDRLRMGSAHAYTRELFAAVDRANG